MQSPKLRRQQGKKEAIVMMVLMILVVMIKVSIKVSIMYLARDCLIDTN